MSTAHFRRQREQLVERELRLLGVRDEAVLHAMRTVPREAFVSEEMREFAEWIWFDETSAVRPLSTRQSAEHEPSHPFAVIDR